MFPYGYTCTKSDNFDELVSFQNREDCDTGRDLKDWLWTFPNSVPLGNTIPEMTVALV